jgi:hypothetical protein
MRRQRRGQVLLDFDLVWNFFTLAFNSSRHHDPAPSPLGVNNEPHAPANIPRSSPSRPVRSSRSSSLTSSKRSDNGGTDRVWVRCGADGAGVIDEIERIDGSISAAC